MGIWGAIILLVIVLLILWLFIALATPLPDSRLDDPWDQEEPWE
jgi:hypothetical protein